MITRWFDEAKEIIHIRGEGYWTPADLDIHYADMRRMIAEMRAAGRTVRVCSDVRGGEHQSAVVEQHNAVEIGRLFQPEDRVAILARDPRTQSYLRRRMAGSYVSVFCSPLAAEIWLSSDVPRI